MPNKKSPRQLSLLGYRMRELRKEKRVTLAQLAARCGTLGWEVTHNTLGKIEAGQRSIFDIEVWVLAKAFRIPVEEFFPQRLSPETVSKLSKRPSKKG